MASRTQVAIIGGGPAGSLLSLLLSRAGIACQVLERQTRGHVLSRIRAGVLESGTVEVLREAGVGERMEREGHAHDGFGIAYAGKNYFVLNAMKHTGRGFMAYGQSAIQQDLYAALDDHPGQILFEVSNVQIQDVEGPRPQVTYVHEGAEERIECDYVVGCDGYHGVSRTAIPRDALHTYEKDYPFGWLGILSETPPLENLVYVNHPRGFALASQRSPMLSRYYIQCSLEDTIDDWPDERFWQELLTRFPPELAKKIVTGPSIEKSIAPLRSFVAEPMCYGKLYLAGDAAHIVPPTGAKGLNLAVSDVFYLSRGLIAHYRERNDHFLSCYSEMALRRVWRAVRFSWWMTMLLHRFPDQTEFDQRAQEVELDSLASSEAAMRYTCEQYAGLPFES